MAQVWTPTLKLNVSHPKNGNCYNLFITLTKVVHNLDMCCIEFILLQYGWKFVGYAAHTQTIFAM